ncbi:MAG: hypothetical protein CMP24_06075, partial [Rickettsiales bacterium]|nr:hypothetical protein [Rickettsiales bacterium]
KKDEDETLKSFRACRKILEKLFDEHDGRVFNTAGDSILAEFSSAVSAVVCASEFQNLIKERNDNTSSSIKMNFRIGINMGDVVKEGDNLYGDGVNIAARLEALSQPNGVCLSKSVFDLVSNKTKFVFSDLGEQKVKDEQFHAFDVLIGNNQKRSLKGEKRFNVPLYIVIAVVVGLLIGVFFYIGTDREQLMPSASQNDRIEGQATGRSLLILPFKNKGNSDEFDYLSEGITDHLISSISPTTILNILSTQRSYLISKNEYSTEKLRDELGISFIVNGSILTSGDKFRVNIELTDLKRSSTIWSSNKEYLLTDLFSAQDQIESSVRRAIQIHLTMGKVLSSSLEKYFENKSDHKELLSLRALQFQEGFRVTDDYEEPFRVLVDKNLNNSMAWYYYAGSLFLKFLSNKLAFKDYQTVYDAILKAKELDPNNSIVYPLLASVETYVMGINQMAFEQTSLRGLKKGSENYRTLMLIGANFYSISNFSEAIRYLKKAVKIAPFGPITTEIFLMKSYFETERLDEAKELCLSMIAGGGRTGALWGTTFLTFAEFVAGDKERAKVILENFIDDNNYTIDELIEDLRNSPFSGGELDQNTEDMIYILLYIIDPQKITPYQKALFRKDRYSFED